VSPIRGSTAVFEGTQIDLPVKNPTYHTIELFGNHPKDCYIAPNLYGSVMPRYHKNRSSYATIPRFSIATYSS
jgi:hypothetical protein